MRLFADWPSAVVHEADIAAVAAVTLTEDGHSGRTCPITGPQALTSAERTRLIGEAIGRDLAVEQHALPVSHCIAALGPPGHARPCDD